MITVNLEEFTQEQILSPKNSDSNFVLIISRPPDKKKIATLKSIIGETCSISLMLYADNNNDINLQDFECLKDNIVEFESCSREKELASINGISKFGNLRKVVIRKLYIDDIDTTPKAIHRFARL